MGLRTRADNGQTKWQMNLPCIRKGNDIQAERVQRCAMVNHLPDKIAGFGFRPLSCRVEEANASYSPFKSVRAKGVFGQRRLRK